jgi:hypothetical protein
MTDESREAGCANDAIGQHAAQHTLATNPLGHLMVPGKLTVLFKMATPRRYKDPEYMQRIAGALRRSPELVRSHLRHVRWSSDYGYYLKLISGFGWSSLPGSATFAADAGDGRNRRSDRVS